MSPVDTSNDQPGNDTPKTYNIGQFDEPTSVVTLPPPLPPTNGWQAMHLPIPPNGPSGKQSGATNNYYYQHIQHNRHTSANDNAYASGYTIENATPQQALLTQGDSGRFEEIIDQVDTLAIEDKPAAN
jgi:hypothetical protein